MYQRFTQTLCKAMVLALAGAMLQACSDATTPAGNNGSQDLSYSGPGSKWDFDLAADGTFTIERRPDVNSPVDMTVTGTYDRLESGFILFTVGGGSGQNPPAQGDKAWAIEVPGYALLVRPIQSGSDQIIAMVSAGSCPSSDINANWVLVRKELSILANDETASYSGVFNYAVATNTPSLQSQYSLVNPTSDLGGQPIPSSATCADGILDLSGVGAVMYLTDNGGAIVHTGTETTDESDDTIYFALDQQAIGNVTALDGDYAGMAYNEDAPAGQRVFAVALSCTSGSCTGDVMSDVEAGTTAGSAFSIELSGTVDSPVNGLISGTVQGGNDPASALTCMVNTNASGTTKNIINCVGQAPGDTTKMFNVMFVSK